jgi:hypothetical protein
VLQNDKYIEFAADSCVDVVTEQDLQKAVDAKNDKRADTYDAKDENGNPVKYMMSWPNLTLEEMLALYGSPANQYNKTGKIPYVAIVDPFTLKQIKGLSSTASKSLIEDVKAATEILVKDHGPSLKRSTKKKFEAGAKAVDETLTKSGPAKALPDFRKLEASIAKEPQSLKDEAKKLEEKILDAAKAQVDDAEGKIAAGDTKAATAILTPLSKCLKGTDLEARVKELLEKTKPATPEK